MIRFFFLAIQQCDTLHTRKIKMKISIPIALMGASVAHAQFDALFSLARTFGLLDQLDCALPCILKSANSLKCEGNGPADTICKNIANIAVDTEPCTAQCGAGLARGESHFFS